MKANPSALLACGLLAAVLNMPAAGFDSGSDRSYGAINIPNSQTVTFTAPTNGVFNCTTITIGCNAQLNILPNALNTPVYLLATGAINIAGGRINVNGSPPSGTLGGAGGPGGFPGGMSGITGGHPTGGDGTGPGGGKNANNRYGGVFGSAFRANTNVYGNALLHPLIGGSGGAGFNNNGVAGGGGGGAILIASSTQITITSCGYSCYISATGGDTGSSSGGGGSGGAIRLIAPIVTGNGSLNTSGGDDGYGKGGSQGRIRIDCLDDYAYRTLSYVGSFTRGSQMFVFPSTANRLDLLQAAGQSIPLGTGSGVIVALPFGAATNQTVTLRAEGFTNSVPIRIAVTPDTGASLTFDGTMASGPGPVTNSFNIVIPVGTISRIDAWTR